MANQTEYTTTTRTLENAVIRVYHPVLTVEERNKRMKQIQQAAYNLLTERN